LKHLCACLPQSSGVLNGWLTFVISIFSIGIVTAVIGDIAAQLGCFVYLKDSVNAVGFVAIGTSIPGVFFKKYPSKHLLHVISLTQTVNLSLKIAIKLEIQNLLWARTLYFFVQ